MTMPSVPTGMLSRQLFLGVPCCMVGVSPAQAACQGTVPQYRRVLDAAPRPVHEVYLPVS